jgi:hypothetical protein
VCLLNDFCPETPFLLSIKPESATPLLQYRLLDFYGTLLQTHTISPGELPVQINVANLVHATCYLHINTPLGWTIRTFIKQ